MIKQMYVVSRLEGTVSWPVFVTETKLEAEELLRVYGGTMNEVPLVFFAKAEFPTPDMGGELA